MTVRIAIVLKGYPRLSETFIAQEIRALEDSGFELCIFSLRHPYDPGSHPIHDEITAPVYYLPEYLHDDYRRVFRSLLRVIPKPGFWRALPGFGVDLLRDRTRNRVRRFGQALVLAAETPASVAHYYTHFMHTPSSVSYYASRISGRSWSISAHAKDIWTLPRWELRQKLASCDWLVTCTRANQQYLDPLDRSGNKVALLYHGLDFTRFDRPPASTDARDGSDAAAPVRLISVGRAVEKKGYDVLLEALAGLPPEIHWRLVHIGRGELLAQLAQRARDLGIDERIDWLGALAQTEVLAQYRHADLFVLPSKVAADGDRDGLPNVLMEAQSQGLACLSTRVSGIPELITHRESGWLVEQRDVGGLRAALLELIRDPVLRRRLGDKGCARVRAQFSMRSGIELLTTRLERSLARSDAA